jgi:hypothetical protein
MSREYTSYGWRDPEKGIVFHWGVTLDAAKPTTGVISNGEPMWFDDDVNDGIDLAWEEHKDECRGVCKHCRCNHDAPDPEDEDQTGRCHCWRAEEGHAYEPREDDHDGCGPDERGTVLAGSWMKGPDGKWEPDESGEYSAIVGEMYTQVVWSKHVVRVESLCSPCYPGQADVSRDKIVDEGGYLAYDLPPGMYGDDEE